MAVKVFWIETFSNNARLGIMARPRGNDWLDDEIVSLKNQKVNHLISLLESTEIEELGLNQEKYICVKNGIDFSNFPMPDRDIPNDEGKINAFINLMSLEIEKGNSLVVHCRMGIGRSSVIAASILLQMGCYSKVTDVIDRISIIRGLKVPDTEDQISWLRKREQRNKKKF
jgi:protein-tyrosine phosphatase